MKTKEIQEHISAWLKNYALSAKSKGFVVGISGGIDSAVTSALCAETGLQLAMLNMPIRQGSAEFRRSNEQIEWIENKYPGAKSETIDLSEIFDAFEKILPPSAITTTTMANTRAWLRMTTLYTFAGAQNLLVTGTGNKIEDFGIGFFTKYGDGGVDISPIADLKKTEVYELAKYLGIPKSIQDAKPTDGLFADCPTDEEQIGASYPELEWAMGYVESKSTAALSARQEVVLKIYRQRHSTNRHKMEPIPVCSIPEEFK